MTKVLDYFDQITQIPRPSHHTEKMQAWIIAWAMNNGFSWKQDALKNIVVSVPASIWMEDKDTIIIQSHMDMVCVSKPGSTHNFMTDPIQTYIDNDWMYAQWTTLGADNGMGIAMALAICDEAHPPLELFFTVDEEVGLIGALGFDPTILSGKYLINLDTEDEGEICISSAGGARVDIHGSYQKKQHNTQCYRIQLSWLHGWHSGVDIHLARWNAIRLLAERLYLLSDNLDVCALYGWQADNAIPASCEAIIASDDIGLIEKKLNEDIAFLKTQFDEADMHISIEPCDYIDSIDGWKELFIKIVTLYCGVRKMSDAIPDLVQTSVNLGVIDINKETINITYAPRSSVQHDMDVLLQEIQDTYQWYEVSVRSQYPGWQQNPRDILVQITQQCYEEVLQKEVKIVAYHAGLECGAIVWKVPYTMQSVSFWPTIKHPHSVHEKIHLPSVDRCYEVLKKILIRL